MEYPEQATTIKLLKFLHRRLLQHWAEGNSSLKIWIKRSDVHQEGGFFSAAKHVQAGVYVNEPPDTSSRKEEISRELGVLPAEFALRLERLEQSRYVSLTGQPYTGEQQRYLNYPMYKPPSSSDYVNVDFVTEAGLIVIGELPDPQAQLIRGFESAIEAIKHDYRLTEAEKRQKINWLQEGTIIARTLSMDAIKAILAGAIL